MFPINVKKRYVKPFKIEDFCTHYKMEDNLENISLNKKFSDIKLAWVFRKRYNITKRFILALAERIDSNSNIIIVIFGTPNSGKSEGAQIVAFYIRYCLWKYTGIKAKIHLAFSTADFSAITPIMNAGDIGIKDESSKMSGPGSVNVQKYLDNITRAIREEQNSFIFVDPTLIEPDVVYYYLESAGKFAVYQCPRCKKFHKNIGLKFHCKCGRRLFKHRDVIITKCKVRFVLYDKNMNPMGHIYLPLHWSIRYRKKYREKKHTNLEGMKGNAGMVTPEIDGKRLERDMKILVDICKQNGVRKKGEIYGLIPLYNQHKKRNDDKIKGDTNYMKALLANVYRVIRQDSDASFIKTEKIEKKEKQIIYRDGLDFADFCAANIEDESMAKVAQGLARGDSLRIIDANYPKLGYYYIQKTARVFRSVNNKNNLGFLFEKWYALRIGVPKSKLSEVLGGSTSNPDLLWDGVIYTIKFRLESKGTRINFRQSIDFAPEYKYALEQNRTYELIFMCPYWDRKVQQITIDPKGPEDISVTKYIPKPVKQLIM